MKRNERTILLWFIVLLFSCALIGFGINPVLAQDLGVDGMEEPDYGPEETGEGPAEYFLPDEPEPELDGAFGSRTQATWIAAVEFLPVNGGDAGGGFMGNSTNEFPSTTWREFGGAWRYGIWGDGILAAQVRLPSGARITQVRFYIFDNSPLPFQLQLFRESYPAGRLTLVNFNGTVGANGNKIWQFNIGHTVTNANNWYQARVDLSTVALVNQRLWGVRILWFRQQAPAGSQIFNDVGPGNVFYQSINNMFRSGITLGCPQTPGFNYCPDNVVTRGQMAAFFARALGLHWDFANGF